MCEGVTSSDRRSPEQLAVALGHPAVARKVYLLLRKLGCEATLQIGEGSRRPQRRPSTFDVTGGATRLLQEIATVVPGAPHRWGTPSSQCYLRAYLRGAFFVPGLPVGLRRRPTTWKSRSIDQLPLDQIGNCLAALQLDGRTELAARVPYVIYLKESEQIVEALKLMGTYATFKLENVRIVKGMRNRVNRLVNSETANVDKTINASLSQLDTIRLIEERVGLRRVAQFPCSPCQVAGASSLRVVEGTGGAHDTQSYKIRRQLPDESLIGVCAKKLVYKDRQGPGPSGRNMLSER